MRTYAKVNRGISGYTAHTAIGAYGGVMFNGSKDEAHEDFLLRETLAENDLGNFCKTAQKPYDVLVVACLCILSHYSIATVSSDGRSDDWIEGLELARRITGIKTLEMPSTIETRLSIAN